MNLNIADGSPLHRSPMGSFLTIIVSIFAILYCANNILVMSTRRNNSFTASMIPSFQSEDFTVTHADGFAIALGVIDYRTEDGSDPEGIPLSDYIEISFVIGYENGPNTYDEKEIETHQCSEEELGLKDISLSKFYPPKETALEEL